MCLLGRRVAPQNPFSLRERSQTWNAKLFSNPRAPRPSIRLKRVTVDGFFCRVFFFLGECMVSCVSIPVLWMVGRYQVSGPRLDWARSPFWGAARGSFAERAPCSWRNLFPNWWEGTCLGGMRPSTLLPNQHTKLGIRSSDAALRESSSECPSWDSEGPSEEARHLANCGANGSAGN